MDLASVVERDCAEVQIRFPNGAATGVFFTLAGPEHARRRAIVQQMQRGMRKSFERTGKIKLDDPAEEVEKETEFLVACTLGWRTKETPGAFPYGGKPLAFSADAAREIYEDPERAWLRRFVKQSLDDGENFIGSSSSAS
jgi:hypothetical protein